MMVAVDVDEDGLSAPRADEYAEALLARVAAARVKLAEATATANLSGVAQALDELEDAHGQARRSGVAIPRAAAAASQDEQGKPR